MCGLPVGWQYALQKYRENVRDISDKVDYARSRTTVAVNCAREYAREAAEYEKQALEVVAVARRDVMLAQSVRLTDFFDRAVDSWAALGRITASAEDATKAARNVENATGEAERIRVTQGRGLNLADMLTKARFAVETAEEAENEAKSAQATVMESENARQQVTAARKQLSAKAQNAANAAKILKDHIAETPATLFVALEGAEKARRLADQAIVAAVEGNKKSALSLAAAAESAADGVVKAKDKLSLWKEGAHNILFELQLEK